MTTHPPHPPSEMVEAVRKEVAWLYGKYLLDDEIHTVIRTMFAHVDRAAMEEAVMMASSLSNPAAARSYVDAALAAALAAALPGDA